MKGGCYGFFVSFRNFFFRQHELEYFFLSRTAQIFFSRI
ncbi:hypothetical protein BROOK1789C_1190 [Bathymodiolus brooksi thiotrophic gill symbiont]|nr:hypothetical protein BROOK1789C_1190 [Bathymodiolus brooksi thiotrophic gill symbiont]